MSSGQSTRSKTAAGIAITAVLLVGVSCSRNGQPAGGVVVESCEPGKAAAVSGLLPRDTVVAWAQGSANGDVRSIFNLSMVEQELASRGPVELTVVRGSSTRHFVIPTGRWRVLTRPLLTPAVLAVAQQAHELEADDDFAGAANTWADLARATDDDDHAPVSSWAYIQAAMALAEVDRPDDCLDTLDVGAENLTDERQRASYWERAGNALLESGQTATAADAFQSAIEILEAGICSPGMAFHRAISTFCSMSSATDSDRGPATRPTAERINLEYLETSSSRTVLRADSGILRCFKYSRAADPDLHSRTE